MAAGAVLAGLGYLALIQITAQREQFVGGNPVAQQTGELLSGSVERGDDHQVVVDLVVLADRPHRQPDEIAPRFLIEDRDRLEAAFRRDRYASSAASPRP